MLFMTQKSSLKWQLKAEALEKKFKSSSKDGLAPEKVVPSTSQEQAMAGELI